jgi:hypothetical protein
VISLIAAPAIFILRSLFVSVLLDFRSSGAEEAVLKDLFSARFPVLLDFPLSRGQVFVS